MTDPDIASGIKVFGRNKHNYHIINEEDLSNVYTKTAGIFHNYVNAGAEVKYGDLMAEITDPYEGNIVEKIIAPTDGIVFFKQAEPLVNESDVVYRMIHRLHE